MDTNGKPPKRQRKSVQKPKVGHKRLSVSDIHPSPENAEIYRPIDVDDPEIEKLSESIREHGVLEPLVITKDKFIISGHRRRVAALLAGVETVPCRVENFSSSDDPERFLRLLREHNRQRIKDPAEQIREAVIDVNPDEAYEELLSQREESSAVEVETIKLQAPKHRSKISKAKLPMLEAVQAVLEERREFLPISVRAIHYALLNDPPLKHASKPDSVYRNDHNSYKSLVDILTRARVEGRVSDYAICDETRAVSVWKTFPGAGRFVEQEFEDFLQGYWRDLQQSQPNHIEIVAEKLTVAGMINQVAQKYCIPTTMGRGYSSRPPQRAMVDRFEASGKEKFLLLFVADFDPDGEVIAESYARTLRDEFGVENIIPVKAALTHQQIEELKLPASTLKAKKKSSNYAKFASAYGDTVYELEALQPAQLQELLAETIRSVMDVDLYNEEVEREREDAAELKKRRLAAMEALKS